MQTRAELKNTQSHRPTKQLFQILKNKQTTNKTRQYENKNAKQARTYKHTVTPANKATILDIKKQTNKQTTNKTRQYENKNAKQART